MKKLQNKLANVQVARLEERKEFTFYCFNPCTPPPCSTPPPSVTPPPTLTPPGNGGGSGWGGI